MTDREVIVNIQKSITGERKRSASMTREEAVYALRYIYDNVLCLTPEEAENFTDVAFLNAYDLFRYARMAVAPESMTQEQVPYLLALLYPDRHPKYLKENVIRQYLITLQDAPSNRMNIWDKYHSFQNMWIIIRWLTKMLFNGPAPDEILYMIDENEQHFIDLIYALKLDTFYNEYFISPVDMMFFSWEKAEKQEYLGIYLTLRLRHTDGINHELLEETANIYLEQARKDVS